jgi:hypothetical protein
VRGGSVQERREAARRALDPMLYVRARSDINDSRNLSELVDAYSIWAPRPDALAARKAIVSTLLGHSSLPAGLEALLTAVDADKTARERDPLWRDLVRSVGDKWNSENFKHGRDLAQIETRQKPKDLVLESLAHLRPERLLASQKTDLASDFIDMFPSLKPDQKPAVNKALHDLAGNDVVEILAGRGITEDANYLHVVRERQRVLDEVKRNPVQEAPAEE